MSLLSTLEDIPDLQPEADEKEDDKAGQEAVKIPRTNSLEDLGIKVFLLISPPLLLLLLLLLLLNLAWMTLDIKNFNLIVLLLLLLLLTLLGVLKITSLTINWRLIVY